MGFMYKWQFRPLMLQRSCSTCTVPHQSQELPDNFEELGARGECVTIWPQLSFYLKFNLLWSTNWVELLKTWLALTNG